MHNTQAALTVLLCLLAGLTSASRSICNDTRAAAGKPKHKVYLTDRSVILGYSSSVASKSVWHYLGIPYAKPPLDDRRFRRPEGLTEPVGTEASPYPALAKPCTCYYWPLSPMPFEKKNPGLMMWWNNTAMSEDCLYLNVWTPTADKTQKKAVMLWIYGGGFYGGSSSLEVYDGAALASKGDVVVASMQYRMGALGFLHMDNTEAPGNVGLNDQLLAMQWVKKHISQFGGDPDRITIFGESAGGVSVSYHLLSPYSQAYFTRAIMQSGTAIAWWASEDRAQARQRAMYLANEVGCYIGHNDASRIVNCLRSVDVTRLQTKTTNVLNLYNSARSQRYNTYWSSVNRNARKSEPYMYFDLPFKPVYGTEFIPNDPMLTLSKGTFKESDLLMGVMKDEGIFWIVYALQTLFVHNATWSMPFWWNQPLRPEELKALQQLQQANVDTERDPYEMVARYFITSININNPLTEAIAFEYQVPSRRFGYKAWTSKNVVDAFDDLTGDRSFKCPVIDFADAYQEKLSESPAKAQKYKLWLYSFEHRTENVPHPKWAGAMHGYELDYVFGMPYNDRFKREFYYYNEAEAKLSDDVMKFWSNFAKTGNPNTANPSKAGDMNFVEWPPYLIENKSHIVLDVKPGLSHRIGSQLRRRQCRFWSHHINNIRAYLKNTRQPCSSPTQPEPSNSPPSLSNSSRLLSLLLATAVLSVSQSALNGLARI